MVLVEMQFRKKFARIATAKRHGVLQNLLLPLSTQHFFEESTT